jgi:methylenetetrahydrofolate reductase (NADPH)
VRDIGDFHYANELVEFVKSQYNHHFHIEMVEATQFLANLV